MCNTERFSEYAVSANRQLIASEAIHRRGRGYGRLPSRSAWGMLLLHVGFAFTGNAATITTGIDEEARLPYWHVQDEGASIRLVQRLPDQTRAFFMARGFSADQAELIAQSCVFQTVFKNISNESRPSPIRYTLRDWTVRRDGVTGTLKTREDWAAQWEALNVSQAARIAFEWSLFPTHQTYQPGDYNWGMSIFQLPPGTSFQLDLSWTQYGETRGARIQDIRCAADIRPEPGDR